MSSPTFSNPWGFLEPSSLWGRYNNLRFMIQQMLSKVQTATIVKVIACTNDGGVSPVGTVDVQIIVNQMGSLAGQMVGVPHVTMYSLPYLRIQGGTNAVIIDPQPGDIGIAVFASRDITNVKSTKTQANPGSFRMHDFGDGMYLGGLLNGSPSQFVQFNSSGITLISPGTITLQAPNIVLNGALQQTGGNATMSQSLTVTGDVTAEGTSLHAHVHGGVTAGSADTGVPV